MIKKQGRYHLLLKILEKAYPGVVAEYKFHPERKWRFDFCWPDEKIALEIEGGLFTHGRHVRGVGARCDITKYNEATLMGYRLYRVTPDDFKSGAAFFLLDRIFKLGV